MNHLTTAENLIKSYLELYRKYGVDRTDNLLLAKESARILVHEKIKEFQEMNNNIAGIQFTERIKDWDKVLFAIETVNKVYFKVL